MFTISQNEENMIEKKKQEEKSHTVMLNLEKMLKTLESFLARLVAGTGDKQRWRILFRCHGNNTDATNRRLIIKIINNFSFLFHFHEK